MPPTKYQLAQINIAQLLAPLDDPLIKEFKDFLDPVNQLGADSPGFVWIYRAEDGQAASYGPAPFENPLIVINYTVWEDYESLHHFVYNTVHAYFLKNRKKWTGKLERPHVAMWWIPAGHTPTLAEGIAKLDQLRDEGPSPSVFNLRQRYTADGQAVAP